MNEGEGHKHAFHNTKHIKNSQNPIIFKNPIKMSKYLNRDFIKEDKSANEKNVTCISN